MNIIALDTETTGLLASDEIVEFAWAELDPDLNILRRDSSLIKPNCPISPSASGVHGITMDKLVDAPTMHEYFNTVEHPFDAEQILMVAYNAPFDRRFVGKYVEITASLCALKLARKIYIDSPDHKLTTLKYYLNLESEGASHSAAGDVSILVSLMRRMCQDTNLDFFGLYDLADQPTLITKMGYGKHKGMALKDLPANYVRWLIESSDLSDDMRYSLMRL